MSGDEHSSDESMIGRDEYEASRQDSANERAVICASVEDLKAEMGVRFAEVLAAVRDRDGGAAAGGAAGAAPAPGYGGARAAAGVAPAPMYAGGAAGAAPAPGYGGARAAAGVAPALMYGGANAGYGLHRVESSPGLLQGAGRYGSGGGLGFTPASSSPFGAGGLNVDSGGYGMGTGVSHAQRRMEKVISDQRVNAWSAVNSRMWLDFSNFGGKHPITTHHMRLFTALQAFTRWSEITFSIRRWACDTPVPIPYPPESTLRPPAPNGDELAGVKPSQIGAGGGAVAVLVELMACHLALPEDARLCSFRCRRSKTIKVWGYSKALRALRQIVEKAGGDPKQVGLHSLRIGAATTLAAGGDVPDRIIQREGRWKEGSGTFKIYTRNNMVDVDMVSRKLAKGKKTEQKKG